MKIKSIAFSLLLFIATIVVFITNGCHGVYLDESNAASVVAGNKIYIGIHNDKNNRSLDHTLLKSFLKDYGLQAELKAYKSYTDLINDFNSAQLDLAIARTSTRHLNSFALTGPAYDDLQISLYCRNQNISKIYLPNKLNFIQNEFLSEHPDFKENITLFDDSFEHLINESYQLKNSCFFSESKYGNAAQVTSKKYFKIWTSQNIYPLAWLIKKDNDELNKLVHIWFQKLIRENKMVRFKDQFEAPFYKMSLLEYKNFKSDIKNKLPEWKKHFTEYAKEYQVPWTLIAAVAYQESKWEADATSYTGVKGFMQLTSQTAKHLGIEDREDPVQSIQGGTYYLQYLYDKTPTTLTRFERWVQALAAYNIGWAHLRDIHRLAKLKGMNAYRWKELKQLLPEKTNVEHAEIFQYGLARGEETVNFVDSVLNYHEALNQSFTQQSQTSRDF